MHILMWLNRQSIQNSWNDGRSKLSHQNCENFIIFEEKMYFLLFLGVFLLFLIFLGLSLNFDISCSILICARFFFIHSLEMIQKGSEIIITSWFIMYHGLIDFVCWSLKKIRNLGDSATYCSLTENRQTKFHRKFVFLKVHH